MLTQLQVIHRSQRLEIIYNDKPQSYKILAMHCSDDAIMVVDTTLYPLLYI
jgi:hypothetical protein